MVASLLEYETVDAEECRAILEDRPYDRALAPEAAAPKDAESERSLPEEGKRTEKPSRLPPKISPEPA